MPALLTYITYLSIISLTKVIFYDVILILIMKIVARSTGSTRTPYRICLCYSSFHVYASFHFPLVGNSIECQYPLLCTAQFYNSVLKCDLISHVVQIPFLVECNFYVCVLLHLEL